MYLAQTWAVVGAKAGPDSGPAGLAGLVRLPRLAAAHIQLHRVVPVWAVPVQVPSASQRKIDLENVIILQLLLARQRDVSHQTAFPCHGLVPAKTDIYTFYVNFLNKEENNSEFPQEISKWTNHPTIPISWRPCRIGPKNGSLDTQIRCL